VEASGLIYLVRENELFSIAVGLRRHCSAPLQSPCLTFPAGAKVGRIIPEVMAENSWSGRTDGASGGPTFGKASEARLNERRANSSPNNGQG